MQTNRSFPFLALTLILLCTCFSACTPPSPDTPPNVVIILTDDQGWGDLSINGNTYLSTPNIDGLAEQGAAFDHFFVQPVCSPTRAEILTGRYSPRGNIYSTSTGGERLDLDETTIAEVFKANGYATAAFGKWHNGTQAPYHPNSRGFEEYYGFCSGHWGNYFDPMLEHNGDIIKGEGYLTDDLTERAMAFIDAKKEQPFLVYLPLNIPHSPMQVPDRWWQKFKDMPIDTTHRNGQRMNVDHTRAAYAMCENVDWNVGRILDKLEELALTENTIVLYLSDNGPNGHRWNGGMKGIKGSTDEGGVRSPLLVQWQGTIKGGKKIPNIAGAIDLLPTLTDLCALPLETSHPIDGKSLKPLLLEDNPSWEDRYLYHFWRNRLSLRNQNFRLDNEGQLFDMRTDPDQMKDVSEQHPGIKSAFLEAKSNWSETVLAELNSDSKRPFTVGHSSLKTTQLPARDAVGHGNIQRSSIHPNCSFFSNWTALTDSITWKVEVLESGDYEVIAYYTCAEENVGSTIALTYQDQVTTQKITEAHDPPLVGQEVNRVERGESYVKDFKPLSMGEISLEKGKGTLTLRATAIAQDQVMDFRLLLLERKEPN
ncbi:MAG: arylsulfatase [Bacteroidota bacterium]